MYMYIDISIYRPALEYGTVHRSDIQASNRQDQRAFIDLARVGLTRASSNNIIQQ